jgi:outer membrane lipoprotein-sorting protein
LARPDSKWTPRDLFRDVKARKLFVTLCFVGLCFGGPEGIRTLDLFHAMEARSQLRHRPTKEERPHHNIAGAPRCFSRVEPRRAASYNETMHRLRRRAPVALALLLSFTLSSCSVLHKLLTRPRVFTRGGKVVPPGTPPPPELSATLDELNSRIVNLYNAINSFQATVQMTPSVGSVYKGKISESIVDVRSFVLFRKPDYIRIIGQAPVLRTNVFDMVSNGTDFRLYVVDKNLFFEGSDKEPVAISQNALENLRPEAFLSAMLIRPPDPATEKPFLEDDTDEENALYEVHFVHVAPDGRVLPSRSIWFDRLDLSIARQRVFNEKGEIVSDTRYMKWTPYNNVMFPAHIDLNRPIDGYGVTMDILEMQMNKELTDDKFVLTQPEGTTIRRIGAPQSSPPQGSGTK